MFEKIRRPLIAPFLSQSKQTIITSTQLLAMNGTPITIVPAPITGRANIFLGAMIHKPAGTAYVLGTASGLAVKYTGTSGLSVAQGDISGFLDSTAVQTRWLRPFHAASANNAITPVGAAALVLQTLTADVTTGTGGLRVRAWYYVLPMVP